jgi:hypothetical protein
VNNNLVLYGLDVIQITPNPFQPDVNVNTAIRLVFNGELNENTVFGNIFILEDPAHIYKGDKIIDTTKYLQVNGSLVCGDKVVLFTPEKPLNKGSQYIVYIPARSIKDILGKTLELDYVSYFTTQTEASLPPCEIVFPTPSLVIDKINGIVWKSQNASTYVIEISKFKTFEHLVMNEMLIDPLSDSDGNVSFDISNINLAEGLYYVRVRALNGAFGEPTMFFIKDHERLPVSQDDSEIVDIAEEIPDEIEVLEFFPEDGFSNVALNLKTIYVRLNRILTTEESNSIICSVSSTYSDESDSDNTEVKVHGEVRGVWTVINDSVLNESYIVFTPDKLA